MDNKEILMKILEQLKIEDMSFQNSVVRSCMIESGIFIVINIIVFIILFVCFKNFNTNFYMKENLVKIFEVLKTVIKKDSTLNKKTEDIVKIATETSVIIKNIKKFLNDNQFNRMVLTMLVVFIEFQCMITIFRDIITNIITFINCYYSPQKIFLDYLTTLF